MTGPATTVEETGDGASTPGAAIVRADMLGTVALGLVSVATGVAPNDATELSSLVVAGVLFVGGCGAFAVGFARAIGRSRTEVIDLPGLFWLTGSASEGARRRLRALVIAQSVIAIASVAVARPPFGVMAPVWGVGLVTLWTARYGTFPSQPPGRRA